jgi:hypothetical protein
MRIRGLHLQRTLIDSSPPIAATLLTRSAAWSRTAMFSADLGLPPALGPEIVRTAAHVSANPGIMALYPNKKSTYTFPSQHEGFRKPNYNCAQAHGYTFVSESTIHVNISATERTVKFALTWKLQSRVFGGRSETLPLQPRILLLYCRSPSRQPNPGSILPSVLQGLVLQRCSPTF